MKPEYDPQVLVARMHIREHLATVVDHVDIPLHARDVVLDRLLDLGDVYCEDRPEIAIVDGKPVGVVVHHAALTIRHPYPARHESAAARERIDGEEAALATGGVVHGFPPAAEGCDLVLPGRAEPAAGSWLARERERLAKQRAVRADRAGQLDLGGAS